MKIKKIKPLFNCVITTMDKYTEDSINDFGLIDANKQAGNVKEFQTVLAVGSTVRDIKEGDLVYIDPTRYKVMKYKDNSIKNNVVTANQVIGYNIPTVEINGSDCMMLYDQDIKYIVEDWEKTNSLIEQPKVIV